MFSSIGASCLQNIWLIVFKDNFIKVFYYCLTSDIIMAKYIDLIINGDPVRMDASTWQLLEKYAALKGIAVSKAFETILKEELSHKIVLGTK